MLQATRTYDAFDLQSVIGNALEDMLLQASATEATQVDSMKLHMHRRAYKLVSEHEAPGERLFDCFNS